MKSEEEREREWVELRIEAKEWCEAITQHITAGMRFDGRNWVDDEPCQKKCDDCTCDEKPKCELCKHFSLLGGYCREGNDGPSNKCFVEAK